MTVRLLEQGIAAVDVGRTDDLVRHEPDAAKVVTEAFLHAADNDAVRVIVATGFGRLAGEAPLTDTSQPAESAAIRHYVGVRGLYQVVTYCKKVVVAEVDGHCDPAGSLLCLAADFVVASRGSVFESPFADLAEANYVLATLTMRANRAKAWMLLPDPMTAAQAQTAGLVNEVVATESVHDSAMWIARRVRVMPLDGLTVSKLNLNAAFDAMGVAADFDASEAAVTTSRSWR